MLDGAWHKDEGVNFGRKRNCFCMLMADSSVLSTRTGMEPNLTRSRLAQITLHGGGGAEKGEGVALSALVTFLGRISGDGGLIK